MKLEENDENCAPPAVAGVHDTMHKIRAAANRVGFNLWEIFRNLEPHDKNVTAVHKFMSVLGGPLKDIIGLGEKELRNLAAYYKVNDGRVAYDQFCRMVHNDKHPGDEEKAVENPYTSNKLNVAEENRLQVLLTKIAVSCPKPFLLKPYFMDYEMFHKNCGIVTRASFFRVLSFLGLEMSAFEHELLFDKYKRDNLSMKYAAFLNDLNNIRTLLREQGYLNSAGRIYSCYKPTFPSAEASLLPRPERPHVVGPGMQKVYQPGWRGHTAPEEYVNILNKIKSHVYQEQIRVASIFERYDTKKLGRIGVESFKNGLEFMRLGRQFFNDMYLSEKEMDKLCYLYADPTDTDRVVWQEFVNDVNQDIPNEQLAKWPQLSLERPTRSPVSRLPRVPPEVLPDLYTDEKGFYDVLGKKVVSRKLNLRKGFSVYDVEQRGTVEEKQFLLVMNDLGIFFSKREVDIIKSSYVDSNGLINYDRLVNDLEKHTDKSQMEDQSHEEAVRQQAEDAIANEEQLRRETNIVEVCAKIKKTLICSKLRMAGLLEKLDPEKKGELRWEVFKSSCEQAGLNLTETELNTVHYAFQSEADAGLIQYPLFTRVVDEHSVMACLERLPLLEEMQQRRLPKAPLEHDFVNFEDRVNISRAMKILCKHISLGHIDMFKEMDPEATGTVNISQFLHLLHRLDVLHLLTMRLIEALMKGFGHEEGDGLVIDYTTLLNAVDIVFCTEKASMKL